MTSTVHGGNLEVWAFPQRLRIAAQVLREVAAYRSQTRHGESETEIVSEHSSRTPYTAGELVQIAQEIERDTELDDLAQQLQRIAASRGWLGYSDEKASRLCAKELIDAGWHR